MLGLLLPFLFSVRIGILAAMAAVLALVILAVLVRRWSLPVIIPAALLLEDLLFLILALSTPWTGELTLTAELQMPSTLRISGNLIKADGVAPTETASLGFSAPIGLLPGPGIVRVSGHVLFGELETYGAEEVRILFALCHMVPREVLDDSLEVRVEPGAFFKTVVAAQDGRPERREMLWPTCAHGWARDSLVEAAIGEGDIQAVVLADSPAAILPSNSRWSWSLSEPVGADYLWEVRSISASGDKLPYSSKQLLTSPLQGIMCVRLALAAASEPIASELAVSGQSVLFLGMSGKLVSPDGDVVELPQPFWALVEGGEPAVLRLGPVDAVSLTFLLPKCTEHTYSLAVNAAELGQMLEHSILGVDVSSGGHIRYGSSSFSLMPRDQVHLDMPGKYALEYGGCPMSFGYGGVTYDATLNGSRIGPATLWHALPPPVQVALPTALVPLLVAAVAASGAWKRTSRGAPPTQRSEEKKEPPGLSSGEDSLA